MIRNINDCKKLDADLLPCFEERLAMELEERQELDTCQTQYCSGVHWTV